MGATPGDDVSVKFQVVIPHTDPSTELGIYPNFIITEGGWGLRNLKVYIEVNCDHPCTSCSGTDPSNCLVCASNRILAPACSCPDRYFDDGTPYCQQCSGKCNTCQGNASDCVACAAGRKQ